MLILFLHLLQQYAEVVEIVVVVAAAVAAAAVDLDHLVD
jgi:hypothetical protein